MKRFGIILITIILTTSAFAWGKTGHRVVGYVAQQHITKKANKSINKILKEYSLEMSGNFMDFIKADTNYRHMGSWHYVSIPDGKTYADITKKSEGDVIWAIETIIDELKTREFKIVPNEQFAIMALVHFIGDIHQPLHVGLAEDRGGNSVKVEFFGNQSNLHRVWDSELIDHQGLSYTEWGDHINRGIDKRQVLAWQSNTVTDWATESMKWRSRCYDFGTWTNLKYDYIYRHMSTVELRLEQAGVRLAGVLNELYG